MSELNLAPAPIMVRLGENDYAVKPLVWGRVFKVKRLIQESLTEMDRVFDIGGLLAELAQKPIPVNPPETASPEEVAALQKQADALVKNGYTVYAVTADGQRGDRVTALVAGGHYSIEKGISVANSKIWDAIDVLLNQPAHLLKLGIPDLDENLLAEDNERGATVDQVVDAIMAILEANHLGVLKNRIMEAWNAFAEPTTKPSPPSAMPTK